MRKISYVITFFAVAASLITTIVSTTRADWLVVKTPEILHTQITLRYGLRTLCEFKHIGIPGGGNDNSKLEYNSYECRPFPKRVQDGCEEENPGFCTAWSTAGYAAEISIGFAALALFAILIGLSTGSRRRRIWKAVAGLVALQAAFELVTFGIVTDTMRTGAFPTFEDAKPGVGYGFNTFSWIFSALIALGVTVTGLAAERGHKWAAGNRAYRRINP